MSRIESNLENLLITSNGEINTRLQQISFDINISGTSSKAHCYCLKVDGNGNLRLDDLIDFIDAKILEYAIPKKQLDEAKKYLDQHGSPLKYQTLRKKAEKLFVDLEKTGEGGEILLYILIQEFLKIPQLISKMSIKTSGKVHYQGVDGIHVNYDKNAEVLNLYWGEAKMYSKVNDAIRECLKSIKSYLLDPISSNSVQERDLDLITSHISENINDPELEDALVRYFDKDNELSNKVVYKGVCFIGFDCDKYKKVATQINDAVLKTEIDSVLSDWHKELGKKIASHKGLELKELHIFLMPFPSVSEFRKKYLEVIK